MNSNHEREAKTDIAIHKPLRKRWSPYTLDPNQAVSADDVQALLEAARWTMSAFNAQPWRYVVAVKERDPETWQAVRFVLVEGNQPWAKNAPVLMLGIVEKFFEHNGKPNHGAEHDLGAASAMLTVEATVRGLFVHQMSGIDPEKAREVFALPESKAAVTALAIGYLGADNVVPEEFSARQKGPRQRKALSEIVIKGGF